MLDLELVDVKTLFDNEEIEYSTHGKNISSGWIGISCPYCGDQSNHCGVKLDTGTFSCWICQEHGNIIKLIKEIKQISYRKAEIIAGKYIRDIYSQPLEQRPTQPNVGSHTGQRLIWPSPIVDSTPPMHRQYLKSRGFDVDYLTKKYKLRFTPNVGKHRFCIITPIIMDNRVLSWIACDVIRDGSGKPPYVKCPNQSSVLPANSCLYNIDSVGEVVVLVEGVTDVWRCGDGFVATMTKGITSEQVAVLVQKNIKKVFVMFDDDAVEQSRETAKKLSGLFETEFVELSEGDPADMSLSEVAEVRRLLVL